MNDDLAGGQHWSSETIAGDIAALNLPEVVVSEALLRLQQIHTAASLKDLALHLAYSRGLVRGLGLGLGAVLGATQAQDLVTLFETAHRERVNELGEAVDS